MRISVPDSYAMLAEQQNKETRRDVRKVSRVYHDQNINEGRDNGLELQKKRQDSAGNPR